jgi:hypothetical protein
MWIQTYIKKEIFYTPIDKNQAPRRHINLLKMHQGKSSQFNMT